VVGVLGYIDDVALSAWVLHTLKKKVGDEVIHRHWAGDDDVLDLIDRIVAAAEEMVGEKIWKRLKELVK